MATFEPNRDGIRELLRSNEIRMMLAERAHRVADTAASMSVSGRSTYRVDSEIGKKRARAAVLTDSPAAMMAEATMRRLAIAIDAAR